MSFSVIDYASMINAHCREFRYFWAYGLLKETLPMWKGENKRWLSNWSQTLLRSIEEEVLEDANVGR